MARFRQNLPASVFVVLLMICAGCGGASQSPLQSLSPSADFQVTVSSSTVSVSQGATSSPIVVSISAKNGFGGVVQITISGQPAGITSNPPSPFSVAAGADASVIFGAASNAPTGDFHLTAQGSSGALSHSATVALIVNAASLSALPRTTYLRSDAVSAFDDPPAEPHHRRIAYDPTNKHVFVANRAMNRVEVFRSKRNSIRKSAHA